MLVITLSFRTQYLNVGTWKLSLIKRKMIARTESVMNAESFTLETESFFDRFQWNQIVLKNRPMCPCLVSRSSRNEWRGPINRFEEAHVNARSDFVSGRLKDLDMVLFYGVWCRDVPQTKGGDRIRAWLSSIRRFMSQLYIPSLFISAQLTPSCQLIFYFSLLLTLKGVRLTLFYVHLSKLIKHFIYSNPTNSVF